MSEHLPVAGLIAIVWSSFAFAGAFVIARTLIRIIRGESLGFEDHWLVLAYLLLIINAVLQTLQAWHVAGGRLAAEDQYAAIKDYLKTLELSLNLTERLPSTTAATALIMFDLAPGQGT